MTVLVTGGAGYIGSHTVRELAVRGRDVVVIDNLTTGHREAVHPQAAFFQGDIRDAAFLDSVFAKQPMDAVVHFAANSLVGESVADPLKYYDNNFHGTLSLVKAMVRHGVTKIVFSSTAATYGEPERVPILESDRTRPQNPYGETKLAMETMFRWVAGAHDFRSVPLRYFNAAGAAAGGTIGEDHSPESHLIPIVLQVANGLRERVMLFGDDYDTPDGTCLRDYIHVTDLAEAHIQALDYLGAGGASDVFNLGNGVGFSVKEVVEMCREVTGVDIPAEVSGRRPGDPARLVASSEKARQILGFNPRHSSLREIVSSAWAWHKTHPHGYAQR